jgi:hypothetical protein
VANLKDSLYLQQQRLPEIPPGFPQGHPVEGDWHLPILAPVLLEQDPLDAIAFDDRKRVADSRRSVIHFYRDDSKFMGVILKPKAWVHQFSTFGFVITPDLSLGDDMPEWVVAHRVFYSRAVGVVWQKCGIVVIPHLRWRHTGQISQVVKGISVSSTVAVSNYGFRRNKTERQIFAEGLAIVLELLKPQQIILYGSIKPEFEHLLSAVPKVLVFEKRIVSHGLAVGAEKGVNASPSCDTLF